MELGTNDFVVDTYTCSVQVSHSIELSGDLNVPIRSSVWNAKKRYLDEDSYNAHAVSPIEVVSNISHHINDPRILGDSSQLPRGLVLITHGSGGCRTSERARLFASRLNRNGLATFVVDLLTPEEDSLQYMRFDIDMLSHRVSRIIQWIKSDPINRSMGFLSDARRRSSSIPINTSDMRIGVYSVSTGIAACLRSCATQGDNLGVSCIVGRSGLPDLAGKEALARVHVPCLFIVGSLDQETQQRNESALKAMSFLPVEKKRLEIIHGASNPFNESGKIELVADLACNWFTRWLLEERHDVALTPTGL